LDLLKRRLAFTPVSNKKYIGELPLMETGRRIRLLEAKKGTFTFFWSTVIKNPGTCARRGSTASKSTNKNRDLSFIYFTNLFL
jgi:hypothetical protein